jgi:multiple sugar transport system substrate-binding protein
MQKLDRSTEHTSSDFRRGAKYCGRLTRLALMTGGIGMSMMLSHASATEITVWSGYPELGPYYERVAQTMKKKYPDLVVNVQAIPLREHEKRIALSLPSGSAADVIELADSSARRFLEASLLKAAPDTVSQFVSSEASYEPHIRASASFNGKVYGVPLFRGQSALYYNTEMFEKAGLSSPPKTMAEFTEYAKKLTQRDASGIPVVSGWSLRLTGGGQGIAEKFWINLHQFGGALLKQTPDGKWSAGYATPEGRAALKQYVENVQVFKTVTPEMKADAEAFELGQTAMFIRESWVIGDIKQKAPNLKYATAPLPVGSIGLVTNLYVSSENEKGKLAWEFAMTANEPDQLLWELENVGWLTNRKDVDYAPVIKKIPALDAYINYPKNYTFFTLPAIAPIEEILTRFAARLTKAYTDPALAKSDAAIDAVLSDAATETNNILKRAGLLATN